MPALAAELRFWTRLREGVNPGQSEIAPVYELGPALSNLQGLLDAVFRAAISEKRMFHALNNVLERTSMYNPNDYSHQ